MTLVRYVGRASRVRLGDEILHRGAPAREIATALADRIFGSPDFVIEPPPPKKRSHKKKESTGA